MQQKRAELQNACFQYLNIQATIMTSTFACKLHPLAIGSSAVLNVPTVDRGLLDFPNIVGIVADFRNYVYQIGTKNGIIKQWHNFSKCENI